MTFASFNTLILIISLISIAALFFLYPIVILIASFFIKQTPAIKNTKPYKISFIIVAHNAEALILKKINNLLSLEYKDNPFEIIIYLDGCNDNTFPLIQSISNPALKYINEPQHLGKHIGLNKAVEHSTADILIFSDVDAILEKNAVLELLSPFSNPQCGGVCGKRHISDSQGKLRSAQKYYIYADSFIKQLETKIGSISSNDGKLYAIRRTLFSTVAAAVTDDFYQSLSIIEQGYQFGFAAHAKANIKTPARNPKHELSRRRRIVCRSLQGIFLKKKLLNPFQYGLFSISLLINKILRRLLALFLLLLLITSLIASFDHYYISLLLYLQISFYLSAISYPFLEFLQQHKGLRLISRLSSICWYFCLGNYATFLGVIDFLKGERVVKWQPQKTDP